MKGFKIVGKSVSRIDDAEKVTGKAKFVGDFKMSRMLYAKVLRSPYAHAKILDIDTSKAEKLPGVTAVLTPKDVPPVPISPCLGDQYALCRDNIARCVGDPIAAVAAESIEIAEEAIKRIEVEYEELLAVFNGEEAFRPDPPTIVHPNLAKYRKGTVPIRLDPKRPNVCQTYRIFCGDTVKGFQEVDLVVENRFTTPRIQHCQLEPHTAVACFEANGSLTVISSSQLLHETKMSLCELFHLSPSKVRVLSPHIGGGFGGKGGLRAEPIAALLAQKSSRPVKLAFTREEMFIFGGHRVPFIIDIKDGVKRDGTLIAREMRIISAIGAYSEYGVLLVRRAATGAVGTYRVPYFKLDAHGVYTNLPITHALRGFGCPEVEWSIEQQMDIIAEKIGIDPVEIRKKNILAEGDKDASGMVIRSIGLSQCIDKAAAWIDREERPLKEDLPWRRGKGIAIGNKSVSGFGTSVVFVKIWQDGAIEIRHSAAQLGQGISTTLAQIAAEEFEVPLERIKVESGDTALCPFDAGTISSRSLIYNGNALLAACWDAKQQLFKIAALKLGVSFKDLATSGGKVYAKSSPGSSISITALFSPLGFVGDVGEILGRGSYTTPMIPEDPETGQSERSVYDYSYTANAVEVAVNIETGEVKVVRSGIACDLGKAINPGICEGQLEGGIGMGIGSTLHEEIVMDKGAVINTSFDDYHMPTTLDMPRGKNCKALIVEVAEPEGPYGAKGVGEVPLVATSPAIANAVYDAVGVRIKDLPLTREKVLGGIKRTQNG